MLDKAMGDWMNTVSAMKWVIIVLAAVAVAAVIILLVKKSNFGKSKEQVYASEPKSVNVPQVTPASVPVADTGLIFIGKLIRDNADSFNGLYEGIYQLAKGADGADGEALAEWKTRVNNMGENDEFKNAFSDLFTSGDDKLQAEKLMGCIELAGIKRSEETEYVYDLNSTKKYICLSGNSLAAGTICTVLKPYWHIDGKTVEQGCIMRKDG